MNAKSSKSIISIVCVVILIITFAFNGCGSVKKIKKKQTAANSDDKIKIGSESEDFTNEQNVVVGEDGQSYLVDGEGNSVVYDAVITNNIQNNVPNLNPTKKDNAPVAQPIPKPTTTTTSTTKKVLTVDEIKSKVRSSRQVLSDNCGVENSALDRIDVKFDYEGEDCLFRISKGDYGKVAVGGEISSYINRGGNYSAYNEFDLGVCVYQNGNKISEDRTNHSTWAGSFGKGTLENRSSIMIEGRITFGAESIAEEFKDSLMNISGISECDIEGSTVIFKW